MYQFCNGDIAKFVLLQRKGVYPYEYIDSWERSNETSLPDKSIFYSELNLEDITDEDYADAQKIFEESKLKNLGQYHDLCVQCDTLLLADVFENFRNKCIEIYKLDPDHFLSAPGLAWQTYLKRTGVKLELLTDADMLLMAEKGIRGGIHRYTKANNKYINNYGEEIESPYLMWLESNNLYGWAMSQRLPVNGFKWVKKLLKFNESFLKGYNENSDWLYFLEVDVEYPNKLFNLHRDLPFLPQRMKIKKCNKLVCSIQNKEKKTMLSI